MAHTRFYDIPVYRVSRDRYYADRERFVEETMYPPGTHQAEMAKDFHSRNPDARVLYADHLQRIYGGCWEFNEIIGYIRLHFLGSQVRGEYFGVSTKRVVRTRKKMLEWKTWKLAPEIDLPHPSSDGEIFQALMRYVLDCKKELKGRYVDTELFERLGPYVRWSDFVKDTLV